MELIKKNIHLNGQKAKATTQFTMDEDVNVPDTSEDIGRMIEEKADFVIEEVKGEENQVLVKGHIQLDVLYNCADGEGKLQVMHSKIPVEEYVHMDHVTMLDVIHAKGELEDFSVSLINSRKINLKGILLIQAAVDEYRDEEVLVEIMDEKKAVQTLTKEWRLLQTRLHRKDHCRIKDEIVLSSAKPNIFKLLWHQIQPQNVEIKRLEGQLSIHGEMKILLLYLSEEEGNPVQVVEEVLPFHNTVDCAGCKEDMISQIGWELGQVAVDVKPDYDGEERVFTIEAMLEMDIRLFEEEDTQVMADVYSTAEELVPVIEEMSYPALLIKNQSKTRISGKFSIERNQPRILQLYQASGKVKADEVQRTEDGLLVEGVISVQILYVTSDDEMPYASMRGEIPFQHMVEVPDMEEDAQYMIQADLEQLQAVMADSEEVECNGTMNLDVLVLATRQGQAIRDVEQRQLDYNRLNEIPGMVGYIASEGDTLWSIAKEYSTTIEQLRAMNEFPEREVRAGDKFLLLKTVNG